MGPLLRVGVQVVVTAVATVFALGCILAAYFELQGFGAPRDEGARPLYLAALGVGFLLCLAAPIAAKVLLTRRSLKSRRR